MMSQPASTTLVYCGTFTAIPPHPRGKADGIHIFRLDSSTGALSLLQTVPGVPNPSFLALHPTQRYLYAVNAEPEIDGHVGGAVSAFAIDAAAGGLTFLNRQSTAGAGPCHVSVDRTGRFVMVANYGGGSVAMFPIRDEGQLGPATTFIQHVGSSVNPERQQGPHAHSINLDPTNRFALVADLGLDQVLVYRLDLAHGKLVPNDPPSIAVTPGHGPRHLDFHPNGRYAYLINEIGSTLTAFEYDADRGSLREVQTVPTLPSGFSGPNACADVHVHPSGRFVYGSNRGHDSIVIYAVDETTGRLIYVGHESTRGQSPRNFAIDPTGTFLFAANQDTDNIVTFRIDQQSGTLTPTGQGTRALTPVCLKIVPMSS